MERLSEPTSIEPEPFATHIWKQKDNIHGMIASIRYDMFLESTEKCRMIRIRGDRWGAMSRAWSSLKILLIVHTAMKDFATIRKDCQEENFHVDQ